VFLELGLLCSAEGDFKWVVEEARAVVEVGRELAAEVGLDAGFDLLQVVGLRQQVRKLGHGRLLM